MSKQTFIIAVGIVAAAVMLASVWELFGLMNVYRLSAAPDEGKQEVDLIKLVEQWERKKPFDFRPPLEKKEATDSVATDSSTLNVE
ncbi:MAG TPA: hypothetical protein VJL83_05420 [Patescibacteria group bacterium]|nr:hypothetical protein [Patescibacteria group bacterium]